MPGTMYRFIYPDYGVDPAEYGGIEHDPMRWHREHNGEIVTVVRQMTPGEDYDEDGDPLLVVRAADGTEGQVWESELHQLSYPWPNTHDQNGNKVCPKP